MLNKLLFQQKLRSNLKADYLNKVITYLKSFRLILEQIKEFNSKNYKLKSQNNLS
jgi:hypothetical protein